MPLKVLILYIFFYRSLLLFIRIFVELQKQQFEFRLIKSFAVLQCVSSVDKILSLYLSWIFAVESKLEIALLCYVAESTLKFVFMYERLSNILVNVLCCVEWYGFIRFCPCVYTHMCMYCFDRIAWACECVSVSVHGEHWKVRTGLCIGLDWIGLHCIGTSMYTIRTHKHVFGATSVWLGKPNKLDKSSRLNVIYTANVFCWTWYISIAVGNSMFIAYALNERWNNNGRDKTSEKPMTIKSIFNQWNSYLLPNMATIWTIRTRIQNNIFLEKKKTSQIRNYSWLE